MDKLYIMGLGVQYPSNTATFEDFENFAYRHYPKTPALERTLAIGKELPIATKDRVLPFDHPLLNGPAPPTIDTLADFFMEESVKLSIAAARKAVAEWGGDVSQITHVVATTFTHSANPGYDYYLAKELGLATTVQRTLLQGVACNGGLVALRTAANLAKGAAAGDEKVPARVLVVACELFSPSERAELEWITKNQEIRVGMLVMSDGASAVVLSNGVGEEQGEKTPVYEYLAYWNETVPVTEEIAKLQMYPEGIKGFLTRDNLLSPPIPGLVQSLLERVPAFRSQQVSAVASNLDWAFTPAPSIMRALQERLNLSPQHFRASIDVLKHHGNNSSAAIVSILDRLRQPDMGQGREHVLTMTFGPGFCYDLCMLKRCA